MTKQEQIEEIGRIICGRCENGICLIDKCRCDGLCEEVKAEAIYNAGYRKIPEDSVVLSREEFKNYCNLSVENEVLKEEKEQFENDVCNYEMNLQHLTGELKQASKETAEKLLNDFKLWAREYQYKDTVVDENGERPMTNNEKLNYLYKYLCDKYKVEIKE